MPTHPTLARIDRHLVQIAHHTRPDTEAAAIQRETARHGHLNQAAGILLAGLGILANAAGQLPRSPFTYAAGITAVLTACSLLLTIKARTATTPELPGLRAITHTKSRWYNRGILAFAVALLLAVISLIAAR